MIFSIQKIGKDVLRIAIFLALTFFFIIICSALYTLSFYTRTSTTPKDCAVVFGAAVWKDNKPSHALYDRTSTAIDLYHQNIVSCIIFSGGPSKFGSHEVDVMHDIARENNIPEHAIFRDPNGLNTRATIANLPKNKSFVFVSNDFHLARIALLARRYHISNFSVHQATYFHGRYVKEPDFLLHEVIGTIYYFFHIDRII